MRNWIVTVTPPNKKVSYSTWLVQASWIGIDKLETELRGYGFEVKSLCADPVDTAAVLYNLKSQIELLKLNPPEPGPSRGIRK